MFIKLPKQLEKELKTITVVMTGGGTGGHVYPAIAITEALLEDLDIERVIYIGCPNSLEERVTDEKNIDFLPIRMSGMPRKLSLQYFKWLYKLNKAIVDSLGYLLYAKPDIVVGTGGYVSAPVLFAALILDIPFVIHEADAHPGLVNRTLAPWATCVSVAFEKARDRLDNKKIHVLGNPLRSSIGDYDKNEACILLDLDPTKKTLLVLGGSQGAQKINEGVIEALPRLLNDLGLQVIHQCGEKNYEEIKTTLPREILENPSYVLRGFFDDLSVPYACADVAISRAGSLTISELTASGIPSILVPYPFAAADHQRNNAKTMTLAGASLYLENSDCTGNNILSLLENIIHDEDKLVQMKFSCRYVSKKDSTANIVRLIKNIAKPTNSETMTESYDHTPEN